MPDIIINKVVIHELVKEQHQPIQPSNLRTTALDPTNAIVLKLVDSITALYGSRNNSAHYGTFRTGDGSGAFPGCFNTYTDSAAPDDTQFMALTQVAMNELYRKAESIHASSGGYLLFADYSNAQSRFFIIAMIKQKEGIRLSAVLEPEELTELDMNRLYQAARINFGKLSAYLAAPEADRQELSYLSFVSPNAGKTASGYFVTALGCAPGAASARATDTLVKESVAFFRNNTDLKPFRKRFKDNLLAYLSRKEEAEESVKLSEVEEIARQFMPAGEPGQVDEMVCALISHLNSEEHAVPVEFPVNKAALKKHTHISYSADNWDIKFERHALGITDAAQIYFDRENNRITIKDLPDSLIEKIREELENRPEE